MTLLREFVAAGEQVIGLDHEPNELVEAICGECRVLPSTGVVMRMGRWHLNLLRRIPTLGVTHDALFDPTGYPNAFGQHPAQAVMVHDLSMFAPGLYRRGKRTWFRAFYGRALRKARLLVCVSDYTRGELLKRFELPPERCVVVPNSLDPGLREAPAGAPHPATPDEPFFLFVGTIERRKNVDRLLEAFARAAVPHRLVLAGRVGAGGEATLARAQELGDRVVWIEGPDDRQVAHLYRRATALLFPSLEEGFGLPILEAMQCDLPVLTANVTAMPEVAGDAALLVDPLDTDAIARGIVELTDPEVRKSLIAKGRARLPRFDAALNARALLDHLRAWTADGRAGPAGRVASD